MNPAVRKCFEKLERQKETILLDIAGFSESQLRFRPGPDAWSILGVLDHLMKVEKAALQTVQGKLTNRVPLSFRDRAGAFFLISLMQSPMWVKVPASASMVLPESSADISGIVSSWRAVRAEWLDLLRSLQPEQLRHGVFRHPVSGWMTITQALAFLSAHLRHHRYQLSRLRDATRNL